MARFPSSEAININADFGVSVRTLRSGAVKERYKVDWKADFLQADYSSAGVRAATAPFAAALAEAYRADLGKITEEAAQATRDRRQSAKRNESQPWVQRRYSGGRTGYLPPDPHSIRKFRDSGRLAEVTLQARPTSSGEAVWTLNVPVNRLDPSEFPPGRFEWMLGELRRLVPALRGEYTGESREVIERGLRASVGNLLVHAQHGRENLIRERNRIAAQIVAQLTGGAPAAKVFAWAAGVRA